MRGCQERAVLVVADDRQIDQEAEHARAEQIPESRRNQEAERSLVRELDAAVVNDFVLAVSFHHQQ